MTDGEPPAERVPWPRFDVVVTRFIGEGRARYCVVDHLTREHRFPLDPFNKEAAWGLALELRQQALKREEPTTVLRLKGAISGPPPVKRERPTWPPQKVAPKGG